MNNLIISGNIGKDAELQYLQNGTALLKFSIAVERAYQKDKKNKVSDWFNVVMFGKFAEIMATHVKKGAKVLVSGEMQLTYDKEKQKTYTSVVADKLEMLKWVEEKDTPKNDSKGFAQEDANGFSPVEDLEDIPF